MDAAQAGDSLRIEIDLAEWELAAELLHCLDPDERLVTGMFRLRGDGTERRWWATDGHRLGTAATAEDPEVYDLLVSPRVVIVGVAIAESEGTATLEVLADEVGDATRVRVSGGGRSLEVAADARPPRGLEDFVAGQLSREAATFETSAEALGSFLLRCWYRPIPADHEGNPNPLFNLIVSGDTLAVVIDWPSLGFTRYELGGTGDGQGEVAVPPVCLREAVETLEGEVTLRICDGHDGVLSISDGTRLYLIGRIDTAFDGSRARVEEVLVEVFGPDVLHDVSNGHYLLANESLPVHAHLEEDDFARLRVYAVVLSGVEAGPELLAELNDHNVSLGFARTYFTDGQVIVEADLVASTLDPREVVAAYRRVREMAAELGPLLHTMFGGVLVADALALNRWADYREAVLQAEVMPGDWRLLNGPEAIDPWCFPDEVHLLTACDPFGRSRPGEVNAEMNRRLAADVLEAGGGCLRSLGMSHDGEYAEAGFLVWDLDRDEVVALALRYGQEAIYELTADELHIVRCADGWVETQPRLA